jgi:hypothetical protein
MFEAGNVYRYTPMRWPGDTKKTDFIVVLSEPHKCDSYHLHYIEIGSDIIKTAVVHPAMLRSFQKLENPEDV